MGAMPIRRQQQDDDASDDEILLVAPPLAAAPLATTSTASRTPAAPFQSNKRSVATLNEQAIKAAKAPRRSEPFLSLPSNKLPSSNKRTEDASQRSAKRRKTLADLPTATGLLSDGALGAAASAVLTPPTSKSNRPTGSGPPAPVRQHTRWTDDASGSSSKRISYYSPPPPVKRSAPSSSVSELSIKRDGGVAVDRPPSSAPPSKRKRTRSPTFDLTITRSPPSKSGSNSPPRSRAKGKEVEAHLPSPTSLPSPPLPTLAAAAIGAKGSVKVDGPVSVVVADPGSQPPSKRKATTRSPPRSTNFELVVPARERPSRRSVTPQAQAGSSKANAQVPSRVPVLANVPPPPPFPFPNKPAQHPLNSLRVRPPPGQPPPLSRFWRNDDFPPARDLGEWIAPHAVSAKGKARTTMTSSRSREETPVSAAVTAVFSAAVHRDERGASLAVAARLAASTDANAIASTSRLPTPAPPLAKPAVAAPPSFKAWMKQRYQFLEPYETSRYKIDGSTLGLDPDPLSYEWDEDELWSDFGDRYGWEEQSRVMRGEDEEEDDSDEDEWKQQQPDADGRGAELPPPRPRMACTVDEGPDAMFGSDYVSRLCSTATVAEGEAASTEAVAAVNHLNQLVQSRGLVRQFPWWWRSLEEGKGRASNAATKWATRNPYMRGEPDPYERPNGRRATRRVRIASGEAAPQLPTRLIVNALRVSPSLSVASDSTTSAGSSAVLGRSSVDASTSQTISPALYGTKAPMEALPSASGGSLVEPTRPSRLTSDGPLFDPFRLPSTESLPFGLLPSAASLIAKLASVPARSEQPVSQLFRSPASADEEPPLARKASASGPSPEVAAVVAEPVPIPTLVLSDDSSSEPADAEEPGHLPFDGHAGSADSEDPIALLADDASKCRPERRLTRDEATPRRSRKASPPPISSSDETEDAARSDDDDDIDASSEASEESGYPTVVGGSSRASSPALAGTASSDGSSPAPSMSSSPRVFQHLAAPPTVQRAKPGASIPLVRKSAPSPNPSAQWNPSAQQKTAATPTQRRRLSTHSTPPGNTRCHLDTCPSPFYKVRAKSTLKTHERNYHYPTSALHYTMPTRTVTVKRDADTHAFQCPFCSHWSLNSASFTQHVDRLRCSGIVKP